MLSLQVATLCKDDYEKLKLRIPAEAQHNLVLSTSYAAHKTVTIVNFFFFIEFLNSNEAVRNGNMYATYYIDIEGYLIGLKL